MTQQTSAVTPLLTHLEPILGGALYKQMILMEVLGGRRFRLELDRGRLDFGEVSVRVEVLGVEQPQQGKFVWSWAAAFPEKLTSHARMLRSLGAREGISELTRGELALSEADGHLLGLVAVGDTGVTGYFKAPLGGEALYLLIDDPDFAPVATVTAPVAAMVLTRLSELREFDFDRVAGWWLRSLGTSLLPSPEGRRAKIGDRFVVVEGEGRAIQAIWAD